MYNSPSSHHQQHRNNNNTTNLRIYATAYRSTTLPGDADFCWAAMSPLTSIASWGCTIVDRCEIDPSDDKIRLVYLVPANPSEVVLIREKCIKCERSAGGEKGTVVFENLVANDDSSSSSFFAAASPFPAKLVEMTTSLTISRITTLSSPLGRSFVELRSSFVVETPEDATATRNFLENNIFDPLLHSAAEMLIPCHPFRDAMFHSVMKHFESSVEKLIEAGTRLKALERAKRSEDIVSRLEKAKEGDDKNNNTNNEQKESSPPKIRITSNSNENSPDFSITEYTASSISISQELFSAWLETSRELRRIEKKYDEVLGQMEELKDSTLLRAPEDEHHMSARFMNPNNKNNSNAASSSKHAQVQAASRKPFDKTTDHLHSVTSPSTRSNITSNHGILDTNNNLRMQNAIALNANNVFGHEFFAKNRDDEKNNPKSKRLSPSRHDKIASVVLPAPQGWEQEIFDDAEDDIVDQDGGVGDHEDHRYMEPKKYESVDNDDLNSFPPPPPPRRVLGNK